MKDEYKVIRSGNITFAQGYKCDNCGLIRPYDKKECVCNNNIPKTMKTKYDPFIIFIFVIFALCTIFWTACLIHLIK